MSGAVFWGLIEVRCETASDLGGSHLGSLSSIDGAGRYFLTVASAPSYASSMCWGSVGGHSRAMHVSRARERFLAIPNNSNTHT